MKTSNISKISLIALMACGFIAVGCSNSSDAKESDDPTILAEDYIETIIKIDGPDMFNYGQLNAVIPANDLLSVFDYGDIVTVTIGDNEPFTAPVVGTWNDVSSGEYLVMAVKDSNFITMGKNYGQTGVDLGIAEPAGKDASTLFVLKSDLKLPVKILISLVDKGGYIDNLKMREKQNQGKKRDNYPTLSDAEYANFRAISTPGMGKNVLYRSSSPIDPSLGRNSYADKLAKEAKIAAFLNLTDNDKGAAGFDGFSASYYSKQKIDFLGLPAAFTSSLFKEGLAEGLRFVIKNEGPYLVHCREGKDRAGFVSAIFEALMGASIEDIKNDYTKTYTNYYNVVNGTQEGLTESDVEWFAKIIVLNMKLAFADVGITATALEDGNLLTAGKDPLLLGIGAANDPENTESEWFAAMKSAKEDQSKKLQGAEAFDDLAEATANYLMNLGLSEEEIQKLKDRLK